MSVMNVKPGSRWRLPIRKRPAIATVLALSFGACTPTDSLPGTSLGTYTVVGTLGANSCGSGVNPNNPWNFNVAISKDGTTLYMENTDGTNEVTGALASADAGTATLTADVTSNPDADAGGLGLCDLTQSTSVAIVLNSGSAPTSFTASAVYTYAAATGVSSTVNCTDQLAAAGGPYATLPCSVNYTLTGTKQ